MTENSKWLEFLAQRQKRKQMIKEKQRSSHNENETESVPPTIINSAESICSTKSTPPPENIGTWRGMYVDAFCRVASFCNLMELKTISICCRNWRKTVWVDNKLSWRLWFDAMNHEFSQIKSLDRTGKSSHFLVKQHEIHSFNSYYHFARLAKFAPFLMEFETADPYKDNDTVNALASTTLQQRMSAINRHSESVVKLFINGLHEGIESEMKNESEVKGTDTDNELEISLIRDSIPSIVRWHEYVVNAVEHSKYLKLLRLFENVILMESRPILRWMLFYVDRSGCFGQKQMILEDGENIGDVMQFMKCLQGYIQRILKGLLLQDNHVRAHKMYFQQMSVDVDEVRARGVSSLEHWSKSGHMICNPDL